MNTRKVMIVLFAIYLFSFLLGLPGAVFPPIALTPKALYNPDELMLVKSTICLLGGLTPTILVWPGTTVMGPLFMIYLLDFFVQNPGIGALSQPNGMGLVFIELSKYMANIFLDPTHQLIIGRLFILFFSSFAPLALFAFIFFNLGKGFIAALVASLLLAVSPQYVELSYTLKIDTIALMFWLFSMICLINNGVTSRRRVVCGGVFLGLAIASKAIYITFIPVALFSLGLTHIFNKKAPLKELGKNIYAFLFVLIVTCLLFIPFLWIAPLTLLKSFVGNISLRNTGAGHSWLVLYGEVFPTFISWLGMIIAGIGLIALFFMFAWPIILILLLTFAVFLVPLGKASSIYARYALPLLPLLCLFVGLGVHQIVSWLPKRGVKLSVIILVILLVIGWGVLEATKVFYAYHSNYMLSDCISWIKANVKPNKSIAIPTGFDGYFAPNEAALQRDLRIKEDPQRVSGRFAYLGMGKRISVEDYSLASPLILSVFGEKERQQIFENRLLLWHYKTGGGPEKRYDVWYYESDKKKLNPMTPEIIELAVMCDKFRNAQIDLIVSRDEILEFKPYIRKIFYSNDAKLIVYAKNL